MPRSTFNIRKLVAQRQATPEPYSDTLGLERGVLRPRLSLDEGKEGFRSTPRNFSRRKPAPTPLNFGLPEVNRKLSSPSLLQSDVTPRPLDASWDGPAPRLVYNTPQYTTSREAALDRTPTQNLRGDRSSITSHIALQYSPLLPPTPPARKKKAVGFHDEEPHPGTRVFYNECLTPKYSQFDEDEFLPPIPQQPMPVPVVAPRDEPEEEVQEETREEPGEESEEEVEEETSVETYDEPLRSPGIRADVENLIREADEAFNAIGSALAETDSALPSFTDSFADFADFSSSSEPLPQPSVVVEEDDRQALLFKPLPQIQEDENEQLPELDPPRSQSAASGMSANSGMSTASPPGSPTRSGTVSRFRRKQSKYMKHQRKASGGKTLQKQSSRWTLGENVTDFVNEMLNRIEVDEILTPNQIEAYKLRRLSILQAKEARNNPRTSEEDTARASPEPFHLEDLPSSVGASGVHLTTEIPSEDQSSWPLFDEVINEEPAEEEEQDDLPTPTPKTVTIAAQPPAPKNGVGAIPKPKNALRYRKPLPALPSIPEVMPRLSKAARDSKKPKRNVRPDSVCDAEHIFLNTTQHTFAAPWCRHGPVRLAKPDPRRDMTLNADDSLDWTAFQMAILGGAGDWHTDSDDVIRRREAEEADDLAHWWATWDFDGPGQLIGDPSDRLTASPTSTISGGEITDLSLSDGERDVPSRLESKWSSRKKGRKTHKLEVSTDLPIPVESEFPNGLWNEGKPKKKEKYYDDKGIKRWTAEGHPKPYINRESLASLPQSPMMDLHVIKGANGEVDVVPMGYNLGHDLGDFLRWETENVWATFYSDADVSD